MIVQAQTKYPNLEFRTLAAESLDYREEFDVVFCNSSFQWFTHVQQAIAIFASGAAQGYTGREFYDVPIDDAYVRRFNARTKLAMEKRARDGKVKVDFQRLYYVGIKS